MAQFCKNVRIVCTLFRIASLQLALQFCWRSEVLFSGRVAGYLKLTPRTNQLLELA